MFRRLSGGRLAKNAQKAGTKSGLNAEPGAAVLSG
jgi:hypothetical protein